MANVKRALLSVSGVHGVDVSLPKHTATVEIDNGTSSDAMRAAVRSAGYDIVRHDYQRYDRAFDHVPDAGHDARSDARAYGPAPADEGGFGPGTQGPFGQSAYGQGSYSSRYVPGTNHPYADREAHNRYNREHFPQGPHRGKGPKNFTRSDERLKEHANELLMEHDEIDATHVDVDVTNGEVSVTGTVEDRQQRRAIEDLIEGMVGVKDVHISIKIADRGQRHAGASSRSQNSMSDTTPANPTPADPNDSKKARA